MNNGGNNVNTKTHYRKAFNSPYLSSADIVEPTTLTISHVQLDIDKTKKTKDGFNTAYFTSKELRPGEPLKPMILNACNSKMMKDITGSPFIDDWQGIAVTIYVDPNVRFGRETVEGLRIRPAEAVITGEQVAELKDYIEALDVDEPKFLDWLGISSIESMPASVLPRAMSAIRRKQKAAA